MYSHLKVLNMNNQKPNRKRKQETDTDRLNRGDMIRKYRKLQPLEPFDRGDARRNKKPSTQELFQTTKPKKAKSLKISRDLVSRSTNTFAESVPVCFGFGNPSKINMDFSPDRSVDYRKRIKNRYTFRRSENEAKGPEMSALRRDEVRKVNYVVKYDVKHDLPKRTHFESLERNISKEPREAKKYERAKVMPVHQPVHKAISAMKVKQSKQIIKKEDLSDRKKIDCTETEKNRDISGKNSYRYRMPVINTITSKLDNARVYKAVTFIEQKPKKQRKPLQIRIPKNISLHKVPSKSRIPRLVSVSVSTKQENPQNQVKRRSNELKKRPMTKRVDRKPPSCKSMDSMPTEVAKWAPESIDQYTQPYYDAWVNKTLTAISKYSEKDKAYLEKSKVLEVLNQLGARKTSPLLVYENYADETYAGRIRIRQKRAAK